MTQEQLEQIVHQSKDKAYHVFLNNRGWEYENERDAINGYYRMKRSKEGKPLTLNGFLLEVSPEVHNEAVTQLYHVLYWLTEKGVLSAYDLYQYARFHWCLDHPEAVVACQTGPHTWQVNNCDTKCQEAYAKLLINSEWGFEASRIELQGTPYYDTTDWNFIRFRCGALDWLMKDGELYQIYR